ncbi:MAG: hypothetical protein OEZ34_04140 [Spirochaetia bacterium]|nr:hypothetical protein [Spirochaetia bacterium]
MMISSNVIKTVIKNEFRFLIFKPFVPDLKNHGNYYLFFAFFFTWTAGIGRYWDNPRADIWQMLGLGSVVYIITFACILWALLWPLKPDRFSFKSIIIFLGMTSPPAILYAIPVEKIFYMKTAAFMNIIFLLVVAVWRVALFVMYIRKTSGFDAFTTLVVTGLPITVIISSLAALNLEHAVFKIMGGISDSERTANDTVYIILLILTFFSFFTAPFLLLGYLYRIFTRRNLIRYFITKH